MNQYLLAAAEKIYKFVFLRLENLFFSQEVFICSLTFTIACLW